MKTPRSYTDLEHVVRNEQTVLTVGFFDGVHLGHRSVLSTVHREAQRLKAPSAVVTFDRPPRAVLQRTSVPLLTTLEEKAGLIRRAGLSDMIVIPFDHAFAELEADQFVATVLVERVGLQKIVLGYDHRFGRGGTGDVSTMRALGSIHGFEVDVVDAQSTHGMPVSSTRIRELLSEEGNVGAAAAQLGRYYVTAGEVVRGDGRGRTIGFPTANLRLIDDVKAVPAVGVYAVFVSVDRSATWRQGVMNIGYRPTLTDGVRLVAEVHLVDFEADLYGRILDVAFVERLRDEKRFEHLDALVSQIDQDRDNCITVLSALSSPD